MILPSPQLEARDIACLRGETLLFESVSFSVFPGEALQIEGANGSGKTSLLRILAGLGSSLDGEVLWRGTNIHHQRGQYLSELAYLGHNLGFKPDLTATENLRFGAALFGLDSSEESIDQTLLDMGLSEQKELPLRVLSAGQKQRLAMARISLSRAHLWILDEPFTALDGRGIATVVRLIEQHLQQEGLVVLTSHQTFDIKPSVRTWLLQ